MHGNIENIYNKDAINGIMTNLGYSVYIFLDMKSSLQFMVKLCEKSSEMTQNRNIMKKLNFW